MPGSGFPAKEAPPFVLDKKSYEAAGSGDRQASMGGDEIFIYPERPGDLLAVRCAPAGGAGAAAPLASGRASHMPRPQ
jgi:hypothetical protein